MALAITSALAVAFDYAGESATVALSSGGSLSVTIPAVTDARVLLAASGKDLLQVLQAALNAAAGGTPFTVTLSPTTGKVTITSSGTTWKWVAVQSTTIGAILGFTSSIAAYTASATADSQPKYLALLCGRQSSGWSPKTPMAAAETAGGVSYGTTSGVTRWEDEINFEFLPSDPTAATTVGSVATPWEPAVGNLGSFGSHAVPWGVSDCLAVALGKTCALARGNYQALCSSTTERYDLVAIAGGDLAAPRSAYQVPGWEAYRRWTVSLIRQSTPTGTRA